MSDREKPTAVRQLERCGLEFAHIPAGRYQVGFEGKAALLLEGHPRFGPLQTTSLTEVETNGFYIAKEPLRLSHIIHSEFKIRSADHILTPKLIEKLKKKRIDQPQVEIKPSASQQAYQQNSTPFFIAQQLERNPPLLLKEEAARQIAKGLKAALPKWDEWEIGMRGREQFLFPWGNEMDRAELSIEHQDYSVDTESTMGYYSYSEDVYFIHSFGRYVACPSPFGLTGLARAGREWNRPFAGSEQMLMRSISDLGHMGMMVPGIRPGSWGMGGWNQTKRTIPFSGPPLVAYTEKQDIYEKAAVRLLFEEKK